MKPLWRRALWVAAWLFSFYLVNDAFTFALRPYDPVSGRARGCYTEIELLLGLKEPSWIRGAEQLLGAGLFLGIPIVLLVSWVRRVIARRRNRARDVLPVLLPLFLLSSLAAAENKPLPAGLDLETSLVPPSEAPVPPLVTTTVQAEGEPIEELLRSQRIRPGGDALALVYLLNPKLASVDPLPSGTSLVLPAVPAVEAARMPAGVLVGVSLAPKIKRDILASDFSLGPIVERVNLLPAVRFAGPDEKEEVIGALDEIRGFLELLNTGITGGKLPLHPEVLRQSWVEARVVKTILEAFVKSGQALGSKDRETIVQISEDMNLKAASFDEMRGGGDRPRRWRDARVVVRVKGKEDGAPVSGLRVYYVPRALAGRPEEVQQAPAPEGTATLQLPEASYLVWAGTVGGPKPLSPQARVDVRRQNGGREMVVDLPVPRGGGAR